MNINNNEENIEKEITENFFKILITKEILYKSLFENHYKTFLDKNGIFNVEKYESKLNFIYDFILKNSSTSIRPDNTWILTENNIKTIIVEFWKEYNIWNNFSKELLIHIDWKLIEMDLDYNLTKSKISEVKNWIEIFLIGLYSNSIYSLKTTKTIDDIVRKIIELLKK